MFQKKTTKAKNNANERIEGRTRKVTGRDLDEDLSRSTLEEPIVYSEAGEEGI